MVERQTLSRQDVVARLKQLVVDCRHPAMLARFWAAALDDFSIRPYDDAEIARLAALGLTPETDPGVILDGPALELCFQQVDVFETTSNRVHPDLETDDREAEVARLVRTVLDRLPASYGEALEWKYIEGQSVEVIGERLGIGTTAAQSLLARARAAFREALEKVFGADAADIAGSLGA